MANRREIFKIMTIGPIQPEAVPTGFAVLRKTGPSKMVSLVQVPVCRGLIKNRDPVCSNTTLESTVFPRYLVGLRLSNRKHQNQCLKGYFRLQSEISSFSSLFVVFESTCAALL